MMKLLVVVFIIGSTESYDFKNPQYPDQEAQSAYGTHFRTVAPPNFSQHPENSFPTNRYSQPSQEFNVGYSVSFTNGSPSSPKATGLLYPDIIFGTRKEEIGKPNSYLLTPRTRKQMSELTTQNNNNVVGNSWQNLGQGVEIYRSELKEPNSPRAFDHAKALGRSQGFDYTDVIDAKDVQPTMDYNQNYYQEVVKPIQTKLFDPKAYFHPENTLNFNYPINTTSTVVSLGNLPTKNIYISQTEDNGIVFKQDPYQYAKPNYFRYQIVPDLAAMQSQVPPPSLPNYFQRPNYDTNHLYQNYPAIDNVYLQNYVNQNKDQVRLMKNSRIPTKHPGGLDFSARSPYRRYLPRLKRA